MDKVKVAPGVTVASLRIFRAALIGPTQGLPKWRRLCRERNLKTLRTRYCCRCYALGCKFVVVAIRGGIGWLAAGDIHQQTNPPSLAGALLRVARVRVCAMHPFLFYGLV